MSSTEKNLLEGRLTIHVSDSALLHLMFAGMESYCVRRWGKSISTSKGPVETAGLLWGYCVTRDEEEHVLVEHATTDKFAEGNRNEVEFPVAAVTRAKQAVLATRWPYLSLIGDFHTHPYETYTEAVSAKGWEFSKGDRESYETYSEADTWEGRVALVLTIAELDRVHNEKRIDSDVISDNGIRWQLEKYRFWLTGYAIDREPAATNVKNRFRVSPGENKESPLRESVYLDVPTINGTNAWFDYTAST